MKRDLEHLDLKQAFHPVPEACHRALMDAVEEGGYELAATGHYAGLRKKDGLTLLTRGENPERDQSYMLYRLGQRELSRLFSRPVQVIECRYIPAPSFSLEFQFPSDM